MKFESKYKSVSQKNAFENAVCGVAAITSSSKYHKSSVKIMDLCCSSQQLYSALLSRTSLECTLMVHYA